MTSADTRSTSNAAPLRLVTFGSADLVSPQGSVLGPGKPLALVLYLAFSPGHTASREFLIDLLWADLEGDRARHALRQSLWQLRQALGDFAITGKEEITLGIRLGSDRSDFLAAVERADFESAFNIYQGPFLPAFATPGGVEFEHWADLERDRLTATFLRTAELLVRRNLGASQFREAQRIARRAIEAARDNELGWRLLLESLVAGRDLVSARAEADALEQHARADGRVLDASTRAIIARVRGAGSSEGAAAGGTGLVSELIGREREFSRIIAGWETAVRGPAQHLHVSAAAGLGKSRLLQDAEARMHAAGVRVVHARANPGDRTIPYSLASDIARLVAELPGAIGIAPASAAALVSLNPILSSKISAVQDTAVGDEALRRRTLALGEAIAAAAEDTPFALFVDDLHWADSQSHRLLEGLIPRLDKARVLLVTTSRPVRERHLEIPASHYIALEPLIQEQVQSLIASLGKLPQREGWAAGLALELYRATEGSPLLVLETLKLALDEGALSLADQGWSRHDAARLAEILERGKALKSRIATLGADEGRILLLVAVAGAPVTVPQLARAMQRNESQLDTPLLDLERRGLLSRTGNSVLLAHDEIGRAIIENSASSVREAEGALGRALARETGDHFLAARAASHFIRADLRGELQQLFRRVTLGARLGGDRRALVELASELTGCNASDARSLVRTLPLRVRLGVWSRSRLAAGVTVLAAGIGLVMAGPMLFRSALPETELILWRQKDSATFETKAAAISADGWIDSRPLVVAGSWTQTPGGLPAGTLGRRVPTPDGKAVALVVARDNLNTDDIYVRDSLGVRALVTGPGDDVAPSWSPDQRFLAFSTLRWSPAGAADYDVAVIDIASGAITRVTTTTDSDQFPVWSPDGTRIAYTRQYRVLREAEVCWNGVDGVAGGCRPIAGYEPFQVIGWTGARELIVLARSEGTDVLVRLDPDGTAQQVLFDGVVNLPALSPDGTMIVCRCAATLDQRPEWMVFPVANPGHPRRIDVSGDHRPDRIYWESPRWTSGGVAGLTIHADQERFPLGAPFRLQVIALSQLGERLPIPAGVTRWTSSDTAVASVDGATGIVHPLRTGRVEIGVSAGGWKRASLAVELVPAVEPATVFREEWSRLDTIRWKMFGVPRPERGVGPGRVSGLDNNGDGSYQSGAYAADGFSAANGLGVEVMVYLPLTRTQGQIMSVNLASTRAFAVSGWDHRSNAMPMDPAHVHEWCSLQYPAGEGFLALKRMGAGTGPQVQVISVNPQQMIVGWHRFRIQIFVDGTCGFALDGKLVWRSRERVPSEVEYRLLLSGNASGAEILWGPVEEWVGVRRDVDWFGGQTDGRTDGR